MGVFIYYISASIGEKAFAKIILLDRYGVEKWGSGSLSPGESFEATTYRTFENAIFAK